MIDLVVDQVRPEEQPRQGATVGGTLGSERNVEEAQGEPHAAAQETNQRD